MNLHSRLLFLCIRNPVASIMAVRTGFQLATLAIAAMLPSALAAAATPRHFTTASLTGRYSLFVYQGACSPSITHNTATPGADGSFLLPHASILADETPCTGPAALGVVPAARLGSSAPVASIAEPVVAALRQQGASFLVGTEVEERRCGESTVKKGAAVFFVEADRPVTVPGLVTLQTGRRYMIVFEPEKSVPCTYFAKAVEKAVEAPVAAKKNAGGENAPAAAAAAGAAAAAAAGAAGSATQASNPAPVQAPASADRGGAAAPAVSAGPVAPDQAPAAAASPSLPDDGTLPSDFEDDDGPHADDIAIYPSPLPDGASACFPSTSLVLLSTGNLIPLSQLSIGDRVSVGRGQFSEVFMFTHRDASVRSRFVVLETSSGAVLRLTAGHYLYVNGRLRAAGGVRVGDVLRSADSSPTVVRRVGSLRADGLFNPQTAHGDIVVDGVTASCYTRTVAPGAAHALLAPVRALFNAAGFSTSALEKGAGRFGAFAPRFRATL